MKSIDIKDLPAHAKYSPSSMARIMACPGSVKLAEQAPPQVESEYAAEGTIAHALGEAALKSKHPDLETYMRVEGLDPKDYPEDMLYPVGQYVNWCRGLEHIALNSWVEVKLVLDEELFGTVDFLALTPNPKGGHTLHVTDYKHGAGVPVSPEENKQLMTYAMLALSVYDKEESNEISQLAGEVALTIVQPRCGGDAIRQWITTRERIIEHSREVRSAITESKKPNAPLAAGDHCRWCPAKITCPELERKAKGLIESEPGDIEPAVLGALLDEAVLVEERIKALRKYAYDQIDKGQPVPGWKMVNKRPVSKWKDELEASSFLLGLEETEKVYKSSLISPAAARKLVHKDMLGELNKLIESVSSGTVLAPESDKRESVITAGSMKRMAAQMAANVKRY